jgi:hypothetical protein
MRTIGIGEKQANESDSFVRGRLIWSDTHERLIMKQRTDGEISEDFHVRDRKKPRQEPRRIRGFRFRSSCQCLPQPRETRPQNYTRRNFHHMIDCTFVSDCLDSYSEPVQSLNLLLNRIIKRIFGFASSKHQNSCWPSSVEKGLPHLLAFVQGTIESTL